MTFFIATRYKPVSNGLWCQNAWLGGNATGGQLDLQTLGVLLTAWDQIVSVRVFCERCRVAAQKEIHVDLHIHIKQITPYLICWGVKINHTTLTILKNSTYL